MSLSDHPSAYNLVAITVAFAAGILFTLGFKDLYPDLERSYQQHQSRGRRPAARVANDDTESSARPGSFLRGSGWEQPVQLRDREGAASWRSSSAFEPDPREECIVDGLEGLIGRTPLVKLRSLTEATGRVILAKAELFNGCGGTPKDRVALSMIRDAEAQGLLVPGRGDTIYEGTSGSTGISLAMLARAMGYKAHIIMSQDQSVEKAELLKHLGAEVERVAVAPITDPGHFVNLAKRRAAEHTVSSSNGSRGFFADQFENPANWRAHFGGTGPEIWAQTDGGKTLDAFVAGAGTGGTISGVARYLKQEQKMADKVRIVLADPPGSGLYHRVKHGVMYAPEEKEGTRRRTQVDTLVEGIGVNRVTENFEAGRELIDDAVRVTDDQACRMARWLVQHDGVFVGSSSAVNCVAAVKTAMTLPRGSTVVTVLCDSGARHLSKFYQRVREMGLEKAGEEVQLLEALGL